MAKKLKILKITLWCIFAGAFVLMYYETGKSFVGVTIKEDNTNHDQDKILEIKQLIQLYYVKTGVLPSKENVFNDLMFHFKCKSDLFVSNNGDPFNISVLSATNIIIE